MFYDERIERERGRISRNCIIISVICALIYGALNLSNILLCLEKPAFRHFMHLGVEGAIILSGIIILAVGMLKYFSRHDERSRAERDIFYNKAGFVHLCVTFCAWAFLMPLTALNPLPSINFYALPYDYGMYLLFFPIVIYCVYSFKKSEIYFNYSLLNGNDYYKYVIKNIGKLGLRTLVLFAVSLTTLCFSIVAVNITPKNFLSCALSIILTYVFCFASAASLYLLLSVLEKSSYDNEKMLISKATVISFVTCVGLIFVMAIFSIAASSYINSLSREEINAFAMIGITIGELVARANYIISGMKTISILALTLSLTYFCYEYGRVKKSKLFSRSAAAFLGIAGIKNFFLSCYQIAMVITIQVVRDMAESMDGFYLEHSLSQWYTNLSYAASFLQLVCICLMIIALVRDGALHKANIISIPIIAIMLCVLIFLETQTNANDFSYIINTFYPLVPLYCVFLVIFLGRKRADCFNK